MSSKKSHRRVVTSSTSYPPPSGVPCNPSAEIYVDGFDESPRYPIPVRRSAFLVSLPKGWNVQVSAPHERVALALCWFFVIFSLYFLFSGFDTPPAAVSSSSAESSQVARHGKTHHDASVADAILPLADAEGFTRKVPAALPVGHDGAADRRTNRDRAAEKGSGKATEKQPVPVSHQDQAHATSQKPAPVASVAEVPRSAFQYAFVCLISNEKYVDGAVVLMLSLRAHSPLLQNRKAAGVLIGPAALSAPSVARLRAAGFTDVRLVDVTAFDHLAPRSMWKDTFAKLLLWSLVEFSRVVFFDADMLCLASPDAIFEVELPDDSHVGALGSRAKTYFQTGMMLIWPSMKVFGDLMDLAVDLSVSPKYHGSPHYRDGVVARTYFEKRFVNLQHSFSMHRSPRTAQDGAIAAGELNDVVLYHFRGAFKPWMNSRHVASFLKGRPDAEPPEFGRAYFTWWRTLEKWVLAGEPLITPEVRAHWGRVYETDKVESPHSAHDAFELLKSGRREYSQPDGAAIKFRPDAPLADSDDLVPALSSITPEHRFWLLRGHSTPYILRTSVMQRQDLNLWRMHTVLGLAPLGMSCEKYCNSLNQGGSARVCDPGALFFTAVNSCRTLTLFANCTSTTPPEDDDVTQGPGCPLAHANSTQPAVHFWTKKQMHEVNPRVGRCAVNHMRDVTARPTCRAHHPSERRLCPCVERGHLDDPVEPFDEFPAGALLLQL